MAKKKHVLSSRGHPNKDGKNSECSEHIRAIFLPPHANFGSKRHFCANISRFYTYFSVFTTNGAPAVLKNVKFKAAMAKMDAARQFDTACEQGEAIQPDLQIKEFLSILCYQKV